MISAWTKNLPDNEKKDFRNKLQGSSIVLERLQELLTEDLQTVESEETSSASYDSANWAYKQAHRNGYKQAIRKITKLLDLKEEYVDRQPTRL